jgi:hypothetical protein
VSVDRAGGDANSNSYGAAISEDGRFVAFTSQATDLVAGDGNDRADVYVRDLHEATTTRVSADRTGGDANGDNEDPSISRDGRFVAFASTASDLVADDGNGLPDVFVRDVHGGGTTRVSIDGSGGDANGFSNLPSMSADGRFVAFSSQAGDLVPGDGNGVEDVFVRDLVLRRTIRASANLVGGEGDHESGHQWAASLGADGRFVAFSSLASNLVPHDGNGLDDVFVKYARVVTVSAITPNHAAPGASDVPVTITGTGFEPGSVVQVHRKGSVDITLGSVTVVNDGSITARLSVPAGAPIGQCDVRVWHMVGLGFAVGQCGGCLQVP